MGRQGGRIDVLDCRLASNLLPSFVIRHPWAEAAAEREKEVAERAREAVGERGVRV